MVTINIWKRAVKVVNKVIGRIHIIPRIVVTFFDVSNKCQQQLRNKHRKCWHSPVDYSLQCY